MRYVRKLTQQEWYNETKAPAHGVGRPAGGRVDDLAGMEKAILLCIACARKFNAKAYEYAKHKLMHRYNFVISDCDGCREQYVKCSLFTKRGM